jgi:hypothetical protein
LTKLLTRRALFSGGVAILGVVLFAAVSAAALPDNPQLSNVAVPNLKAKGYAPAPKLSKELQEVVWAQGGTRLENPSGIVTDYGYENDVPTSDDPTKPQMVPTSTSATEAQKTEPDKNTYLVFKQGLKGADPSYNYGTHFVFQGHEAGKTLSTDPVTKVVTKQSYITRVNLDADAQHRVTLMATQDTDGHPIQTIDGSTWDPFAKRLLFTTENPTAPTYAMTSDYPAQVQDVSGALGRGGYEGIQNDSAGNIWIVEDIGGDNKPGSVVSKIPNSFIYRYVPKTKGDLQNGKLQVLQVMNEAGATITQASQAAVNAPDQVLIHSYGHSLDTKWITIHDTAVDGTTPFNANTLAKAANGTPFKRPENGLFRPGSGFKQFFFSETGDTNATSTENGDKLTGAGGSGGWGAIQRLTQTTPSANSGKLSLFFLCNENVTGLDNNAFLSQNKLTFVEDAGDTLHQQRSDDTRAGVPGVNAGFDSGFVFDVNTDYSNGAKPIRWLAQGRDASATIDSGFGGFGKNDSDNEITGVHVSNGDPGPDGILGSKAPHIFHGGWRWFWTQQHGDNFLFEVIPSDAVSPAGADE